MRTANGRARTCTGILERSLFDARLPENLHENFLAATGFTAPEEIQMCSKEDLIEVLQDIGLPKLKAKAVATEFITPTAEPERKSMGRKRSSMRLSSARPPADQASTLMVSGKADPWAALVSDERKSGKKNRPTSFRRGKKNSVKEFSARALRCAKLRAMKHMSALTQGEIGELHDACEQVKFENGEHIIQCGEDEGFVMFLCEGSVQIVDDFGRHLTTCAAPCIIGETGLAPGRVRTCSVFMETRKNDCLILDFIAASDLAAKGGNIAKRLAKWLKRLSRSEKQEQRRLIKVAAQRKADAAAAQGYSEKGRRENITPEAMQAALAQLQQKHSAPPQGGSGGGAGHSQSMADMLGSHAGSIAYVVEEEGESESEYDTDEELTQEVLERKSSASFLLGTSITVSRSSSGSSRSSSRSPSISSRSPSLLKRHPSLKQLSRGNGSAHDKLEKANAKWADNVGGHQQNTSEQSSQSPGPSVRSTASRCASVDDRMSALEQGIKTEHDASLFAPAEPIGSLDVASLRRGSSKSSLRPHSQNGELGSSSQQSTGMGSRKASSVCFSPGDDAFSTGAGAKRKKSSVRFSVNEADERQIPARGVSDEPSGVVGGGRRRRRRRNISLRTTQTPLSPTTRTLDG